ncbi:MAG: hypothetical protein LBK55_02915 [Azoarcus sp.]|nr:hypothetical protein [Azoarcus sp.]
MACTLEPIANIANGVGRTGWRIWAATLIAALLALAAGSCAAKDDVPENPDIESGMDMRNEIVELVISKYGPSSGGAQLDVTNLVEKYIKVGDDFESAKKILLKNGFEVRDKKGLKRYTKSARYDSEGKIVRTVRSEDYTYRIYAHYQMKYPMEWTKPLSKFAYYDWSLRIFLGRNPESERIDRIFAIANLRAF